MNSTIVISSNLNINGSFWLTKISRGIVNWHNSNANVSFVTNSTSNNRVRVQPRPGAEWYGMVDGRVDSNNNTRMTQFDIILNATDIENSSRVNGNINQTRLANIITHTMAHELGHVVGLDDILLFVSVMQIGPVHLGLTAPNAFDVTNVNRLYR